MERVLLQAWGFCPRAAAPTFLRVNNQTRTLACMRARRSNVHGALPAPCCLLFLQAAGAYFTMVAACLAQHRAAARAPPAGGETSPPAGVTLGCERRLVILLLQRLKAPPTLLAAQGDLKAANSTSERLDCGAADEGRRKDVGIPAHGCHCAGSARSSMAAPFALYLLPALPLRCAVGRRRRGRVSWAHFRCLPTLLSAVLFIRRITTALRLGRLSADA